MTIERTTEASPRTDHDERERVERERVERDRGSDRVERAGHERIEHDRTERDRTRADVDHDVRDARADAVPSGVATPESPRDLVARQRRRFGGVKVGSALFGWLAATGTATLLLALLAAVGAALGFEAVPGWIGSLGMDAGALGWLGAGLLLAVVLASYFCGGYVAGRMARFDGAAQGVAVWVWALVIAIVAALASVLLDGRYEIFRELAALPRVPLSDGEVTVIGLVSAAVVAIASLGGAVLGGIAGTRYHRRVDRASLAD